MEYERVNDFEKAVENIDLSDFSSTDGFCRYHCHGGRTG